MASDLNILEDLPEGTDLETILLPNPWVIYKYDKKVFKKMVNRSNFKAKPYAVLGELKTLNDLIYFLKLMSVAVDASDEVGAPKINLDANDYIIMRKGIEPIWEDPKNYNGGTFTVKVNHAKGYDVWCDFVSSILGETMTNEMENINGITVSYIPDMNNFNGNHILNDNSFTLIKIWDAKPGRSKESFTRILPKNIYDKIKSESLMYSPNNKKKDFNDDNIIKKISKGEMKGKKYSKKWEKY